MGRVAFTLAFLLALVLAGTPERVYAATTRDAMPAAASAVGAAAPLPLAAAGPCGTPGVPTTTIFLPNVTKTLGGPSGWVTPFIVQNVGVKKTTLEVSFFRFSDGALVTCRKVVGLAPATSFADFPNADEDLPGDSQFSVVVRSFGSEVVSVVNQHQGLGVPARAEALAYNGLTSGATSVYLPFVGKPAAGPCPTSPAVDPTCNGTWITTFVVQNFGSATTTVSARFTGYDGTAGPTLTRTIAPGRSRSIDPTAEAQLQAGRFYSVVVTSAQPVGVVANAHDDAASSPAPRGFSYNGVPRPATEEVFLPYVRRDGAAGRAYPAGVIVQNAGAIEARPTLRFHASGAGTALTVTAPAAIKPGATWLFDPESSALAVGEHSLVVTGGTFAVLGATLVPGAAMGYVGASALGNRAYLPNVTRTLGGARGWTTPIVVQSAGATSVTLRWYRFADGALVTRQTSGPLTRGAAIRIDPRTVHALSDGTQYAVVVDAKGGDIATLVTELNFEGGDGTMVYEGFAATVDAVPAPTAIVLTPGVVQLGTDETAQLTAVVKDQFDEVMPLASLAWQVAPVALGTVGGRGVLTARAAGVGAVTATAGAASETIQLTVVAPLAVTRGGIPFLLRTTGSTDFYAEATVTGSEAATINTQVNADVARIQADYGRTFAARPEVYLLASDATYTTAQTQILGIGPAFVSTPLLVDELQSSGVYYRKRVAMDLARARGVVPFTIARHELTHMMIDEMTADAVVPAWLNEGSARLAEFTIPGSQWWQMVERHRAVSMAVNGLQLSVDELTSQHSWNTREGPLGSYQYAEASQIVELLRGDIGVARQLQILSLIAAGRSFEDAYAAVTGRSWQDFAASVPARLRAIAPSPGIAFAPDSAAGPGADGPSFVIYGFRPNTAVTLSIRGGATGFGSTGRTQIVDAFGVYWSRLGAAWPPDTYTFTVTHASGPAVTGTFTKLP